MFTDRLMEEISLGLNSNNQGMFLAWLQKCFLKDEKIEATCRPTFFMNYIILIISTYPFMILLDKIISSSRLINIFAI